MRFIIKNMNWQKALLLVTVVVTLQSCFVAKDYEQPNIIEEENFRTDNIPQDSLTMANVSWRDMFTDPILQNHIEEGLQNN
ncbi:MAG: TolC family protein, partial [Mesonia sp.]